MKSARTIILSRTSPAASCTPHCQRQGAVIKEAHPPEVSAACCDCQGTSVRRGFLACTAVKLELVSGLKHPANAALGRRGGATQQMKRRILNVRGKRIIYSAGVGMVLQ
ncbi:unnamed protein product [Caretta caretta]